MSKPKLSLKEQRILERHAVLDAPAVPAVEKLGDAIKAKGGHYELKVSDAGLAQAVVYLDGLPFSSVADASNQAVCSAFCEALDTVFKSRMQQQSFLATDEGGDDEDVLEGEYQAIGAGEPGPIVSGDPMAIYGVPDDPEPAAPELFPEHPFRQLYAIDPQDMRTWKADPPTHDGAALVVWEAGDKDFDRGFYLNPGYSYDHHVGYITKLNPAPGEVAMVWSRPEPKRARGAVQAETVDLVAAAGVNA